MNRLGKCDGCLISKGKFPFLIATDQFSLVNHGYWTSFLAATAEITQRLMSSRETKNSIQKLVIGILMLYLIAFYQIALLHSKYLFI